MNATSTVGASPARIRVGSWPGPTYNDNAFIPIFCDALRSAGVEVIDVERPEATPDGIDVFQIHWPEQVYWRGTGEGRSEVAAVQTVFALRRLRRRGVKIVWMVHNLKPHDAGRRKLLVWKLYSHAIARLVDGFIALSPGTLPLIASAFPFRKRIRSVAVRHPAYPATDVEEKHRARINWGVRASPLVLAFVGSVRRYKGLEALITAVRALPAQCSVVAGGRCDDSGLRKELNELAAGVLNVDLRPHRLAEAEFEGLVSSADYVVLPFHDMLHSGSVIHALSLGRPVLTIRSPYTEDLQSAVGSEWVQLFDGGLTPATLSSLPPAPSGIPDLSALSPTLIGREVADFYRELRAA